MSVPGFIQFEDKKSTNHVTAGSNGVFQVVVAEVPAGTPIPSVTTALYDLSDVRKYYFPATNITTVKRGNGARLIFQTTVRDAILPGTYKLLSTWATGEFAVMVQVPRPAQLHAEPKSTKRRPTTVSAVPGVSSAEE